MNKVLAATAVFVSAIVSAQAVHFGIMANVHNSNVRGIHDYSKGRIAPAVGVFAEIPFAQRYVSYTHLVPQLEYSMEGERATPSTGDQKFNNDYVNALLMVKHYFAFNKVNENKDFFVLLGPKVGYNLSQKTEGPILYAPDLAAESNFSKVNVGVVLGTGYKFTERFEMFFRYDQGLSSVYKNFENKTFAYQFNLGLNFKFN